MRLEPGGILGMSLELFCDVRSALQVSVAIILSILIPRVVSPFPAQAIYSQLLILPMLHSWD